MPSKLPSNRVWFLSVPGITLTYSVCRHRRIHEPPSDSGTRDYSDEDLENGKHRSDALQERTVKLNGSVREHQDETADSLLENALERSAFINDPWGEYLILQSIPLARPMYPITAEECFHEDVKYREVLMFPDLPQNQRGLFLHEKWICLGDTERKLWELDYDQRIASYNEDMEDYILALENYINSQDDESFGLIKDDLDSSLQAIMDSLPLQHRKSFLFRHIRMRVQSQQRFTMKNQPLEVEYPLPAPRHPPPAPRPHQITLPGPHDVLGLPIPSNDFEEWLMDGVIANWI